jgi:hypothetical protein
VCACLTKKRVGGWRFVAGRCGLRNHSSKRHQPVPGGHPWTGNVQERWNQLHHPPHHSDTERYYPRRTVSKTGIPTGQQSRLQRKDKVPAQETTTASVAVGVMRRLVLGSVAWNWRRACSVCGSRIGPLQMNLKQEEEEDRISFCRRGEERKGAV